MPVNNPAEINDIFISEFNEFVGGFFAAASRTTVDEKQLLFVGKLCRRFFACACAQRSDFGSIGVKKLPQG